MNVPLCMSILNSSAGLGDYDKCGAHRYDAATISVFYAVLWQVLHGDVQRAIGQSTSIVDIYDMLMSQLHQRLWFGVEVRLILNALRSNCLDGWFLAHCAVQN